MPGSGIPSVTYILLTYHEHSIRVRAGFVKSPPPPPQPVLPPPAKGKKGKKGKGKKKK